jgi:hypothetical protein
MFRLLTLADQQLLGVFCQVFPHAFDDFLEVKRPKLMSSATVELALKLNPCNSKQAHGI